MGDWLHEGYPGRVLMVDLNNLTCTARKVPKHVLVESIGGKGLATRLLLDWDTTEEE